MSFVSSPPSRLSLSLLGTAALTVCTWGAPSAQAATTWVPLEPVRLAAAPEAKADAKAATNAAKAAEGAKYFETQVEPLLAANCVRCHGAEKAKGGLRLDSQEAILKGGDTGPAVKLDKPADSILLKAINYNDADLQMPPAGKMTKAQIDILTRWVEMGLPWGAKKAEGAHAPTAHGGVAVDDKARKWWAFQQPKRPDVPKVKNTKWVANPIDNFILARLETGGLQPAPTADKTTLIRRAYYDLTGLPPTPGEVRNFLADKSPNAYEKIVDRLLASPQYGEKWGRHWLDLVRYAESNSFERDNPKPFVWRYRDYVIKSLNEDKPYDQFLKEQLAGDEMPNPTPDQITATGFYRLGQWDDEPSDLEQARFDELDDIVTTAAQTGLGLTVNCARCHDHKIDPIPQKDYYRFLAFFRGVTRYEPNSLRPISAPEEQVRFARESADYKKRMDDLAAQLEGIEKKVRDDFTNSEKEDFKNAQNRIPTLKKRVPEKLSQADFDLYTAVTARRDDLSKNPPRGLEQALSVKEMRDVPKTNVLMRGSPQAPGDEVQPGFLTVLDLPDPQIAQPINSDMPSSGRRTALANWMANEKNPLTARVMANRLWQYHFGRGIVRSSSNFGYMGTPPTHPELLDWLASEFIAKGWKLKAMHKMIMMSNAYRMSSKDNKLALEKDPDNDLFWRFDMRRLGAEEVRDSILKVNNSLNLNGGGPSIYVEIPAEVLAGQSVPGHNWGKSSPEEAARRSVYIHVKRSLAVPILASFDAADTDQTCPVRFATTQPTQALSMMNSKFTNEQAIAFAASLKEQAGPDIKQQVTLGLWRVLQRAPNEKEIARGVKLINDLQTKNGLKEDEARRAYCLVLLNLNEFLYLS